MFIKRLRRASLIAADASTNIELANDLAAAADKIEDLTTGETRATFERVRAHLYEAESDELLREFDAVLTKFECQ